MSGNTIFNHQGGNRGIGILGKQDIMANAESDNDIQISLCTVKQPGLGYRIAGRFKGIRAHLFCLLKPQFQLVYTS